MNTAQKNPFTARPEHPCLDLENSIYHAMALLEAQADTLAEAGENEGDELAGCHAAGIITASLIARRNLHAAFSSVRVTAIGRKEAQP